MKLTPAQVKNYMRRGLRYLVDPEPRAESKRAMRAYFKSSCAFCGIPIKPGGGDADHLFPAALGGANSIANRVLSCKKCNAEEKRDRDWIEFLREIAGSDSVFVERRQKIENWIELNGGRATLDPRLLALIEDEERRTTLAFDEACRRIRQERDS